MKSFRTFLGSVILMAMVWTTFGADQASSEHWYLVTIGQPYYTYVGTSPLSESDFAAAVAKPDSCVKLDNLLYRDSTGKYKDWHDWDAAMSSRVYVTGRAIVSFQPMVGDPRTGPDTNSLTKPTTP